MDSVLIVDDEPALREVMARWVKAMGLDADTVGSAEEALETLQLRHYEVAVIDVRMPGGDGLWLAKELHREHPDTAVVIATAYTDLLEGDSPQRRIADFLIKPFK